MNSVTIGLDCSTTSATAIAWDVAGRSVAHASIPIATASPAPGHAEQDPEAWWSASVEALRNCSAALNGRQVDALGITFQRETFTLLDRHMEPVRPAILWYDDRAVEHVAQLRDRLDHEDVLRTTGKHLDITATAARLLWLRQHEPAVLDRACYLADVPAFLSQRLTGHLATVVCGVDTTGLVTLDGAWWPAPLQAAGCPQLKLPRLLPALTVAGELSPVAAGLCALPAGLPVILAGGDGHCFVHAALALAGGKAGATLTLGTSAILGIPTEQALTGEAFRTLLGCTPGTYTLESVIQCGSATLSWFDEVFDTSHQTAAEWDALVQDVPPGSHGLLVVPHWRGVRVPHNDPVARGTVLGWNDRVTAAAFRRAIMEGMGFEFSQLLELAEATTGQRVNSVVVGGGGARADVWCGILADIMARPVVRPATVELSALGAALCARAALRPNDTATPTVSDSQADIFTPNPRTRVLYAELRTIHAGVYEHTRTIAHDLRRVFKANLQH